MKMPFLPQDRKKLEKLFWELTGEILTSFNDLDKLKKLGKKREEIYVRIPHYYKASALMSS